MKRISSNGRRFTTLGFSVTLFALSLAVASGGCSVRKFAINKLGDSLANSGTTFASDDDPEFVGQAVPFSLKLIEGLIAESPKHRGLLFAASSGFTQYSYVYLQQPAEEIEEKDLEQSNALRERARKLYLRARNYGMQGLEAKHPRFAATLRENPDAALRGMKKADVPLLYWTALSWGAAISVSKDHPDLVADQPKVEALLDRAFQLDPDYDHGALDQFLISYEGARQGIEGDFEQRSRIHFVRAVRLSGGGLASPYVAYAESVSIQKQRRQEFESMLHQALAIDPDAKPEWRLSNLIMQRRARWLLSREDELFVTDQTTGAGR
jgi:predicted anti-sigma-YlaC factor YlaD